MDEEQKRQLQEIQDLVARNSWIKTPFAYTRLGSELSLIQQNALLMVSDHLQQYIKDFYNLHLDKSKKRSKSLFTEHLLKNGIPPFRIYLAEMGVQPNNYKDAREAINAINLQVEHPEFDEQGLPTGRTVLTNVFSQFGFEDTGDYYHFTDQEGENRAVERKQPYIDVKINPDVAEWAFDMSAGYVNHLKLIARYSTKRPTPRLYLLLMRELGQKRQKVRFTVHELKEYLGIVPYKDAKTGEMVTPYPKFAQFRTRVLEAVKDDLDRMAAEDHTDIKFEYELIYPGQRKRGEPEYIEFTIIRTKLGDAYNVVVNHAPLPRIEQQPRQQELFVAEYADTWAKCLADITADPLITDEPIRQRFRQIGFESFNRDTRLLLLQIPSADFHQWLESDRVLPFFWGHVSRHFGKKIKLSYRLMNSED